MRVTLNREMQCQVSLRDTALSQQGEGEFIDLKALPDRIGELHEAQVWPALGKFIGGINRLRDLRTTGSKADGGTLGGYTAPFVDIAFAHPELAKSYEAARVLQDQFEKLSHVAIAGDLEIEICGSYAFFPGGEEACATRIWFKGPREQAQNSFPVILDFLAAQSADMYLPIAAKEAGSTEDSAIDADLRRYLTVKDGGARGGSGPFRIILSR